MFGCIGRVRSPMNKKHNTMRDLPESEQPYKKCKAKGTKMLSDAELLAVVIRTGTKDKRSVEVASDILNSHQLHKGLIGLHYLSMKDLMTIDGVGEVKAIQIACVVELSKRLAMSKRRQNISFRCPKDIADYFMEEMRSLEVEQVMLLMLDGKASLIQSKVITSGTVNASIASPREIFKCALRYDAVNIVLLHNHPSGDPQPSNEDIMVTKRVYETSQLVGIPLVDHLIIGDGQYISMKERGYI